MEIKGDDVEPLALTGLALVRPGSPKPTHVANEPRQPTDHSTYIQYILQVQHHLRSKN